MANSKPTELHDRLPAPWSYRRVPAARELLDLIAAELAREFVQLLKDGPGEASAGTDSARGRGKQT